MELLFIDISQYFMEYLLYQCGICTDFEFEKRFLYERHMIEQHSGYGHKCSNCKFTLNGPDNHKSKCPGASFSLIKRKTGKFCNYERTWLIYSNVFPEPSQSPQMPSPWDLKKTNPKLTSKENLFLVHQSLPNPQSHTINLSQSPSHQNQLLKFVKSFFLSFHLWHPPQLSSQHIIIRPRFLPVFFIIIVTCLICCFFLDF